MRIDENIEPYIKDLIKVKTQNDIINESIYCYLIYGFEPGGFLKAVLENNLQKAVATADSRNFEELSYIARAIGHHMPMISWGSPDDVRDWLADTDGRRTQFRDTIVEQATMMKLEDV